LVVVADGKLRFRYRLCSSCLAVKLVGVTNDRAVISRLQRGGK
jgi:hypothetical protein